MLDVFLVIRSDLSLSSLIGIKNFEMSLILFSYYSEHQFYGIWKTIIISSNSDNVEARIISKYASHKIEQNHDFCTRE